MPTKFALFLRNRSLDLFLYTLYRDKVKNIRKINSGFPWSLCKESMFIIKCIDHSKSNTPKR